MIGLPATDSTNAKFVSNDTRKPHPDHESQGDMSTKKNKIATPDGATETGARPGSTRSAAPHSWLDQAESFAHREPAKAVAFAFGTGLLLNLLPTRATTAVVFTLARPVLLCLGMLKAWELCSCNPKSKA